MRRFTNPKQVAEFYTSSHRVNTDKMGQWLFAQGDDVHWCAAFAIACCRECGYWVESDIIDRGELRSVAALVKQFKKMRLFSEDSLLPGVGHLYTVEREGNKFGHVGVLKQINCLGDTISGWEGNVSDGLRYVADRKITSVTGWLTIPEMEPTI